MKPELTPFEISIVVLTTQGYNGNYIAAKKGKAYGFIKKALSDVYGKLGFSKEMGSYTNVIRLTHYAILNGYIQAGQCLC